MVAGESVISLNPGTDQVALGVDSNRTRETLAELVHAVLFLEIFPPPDAGSNPDSDDADKYDDDHDDPSHVHIEPTYHGVRRHPEPSSQFGTHQLPPPPFWAPELLPAPVAEDVDDEVVAVAAASAHKLVNQPCTLDKLVGSAHAESQTPAVPVLKGWSAA